MKTKKIILTALVFALAVGMLGTIPVYAAEEAAQADYNLYLSGEATKQGDILTVSDGSSEYTYAVSSRDIRGLDISDSRSYAGDFVAVAGAEGMLLTLTDTACEGIEAEGSWKDSVDGKDVTVTFNGEEQDFGSDALELACKLGKLTVNKDGSIIFSANEDAGLVTISQSDGERSCSVSLQRCRRALPADSSTGITFKQSELKDGKSDWLAVPLPAGMLADAEHLGWTQHFQYSIINGWLYCRQTSYVPNGTYKPSSGAYNKFVLFQDGTLSATADWGTDVGANRGIVRFNGIGHGYGPRSQVKDGIFMTHLGRWFYTADDKAAGAYQFTSDQRGVEVIAAVGRGEIPEVVEAGGEVLNIESNGRSFNHTMQRLTHEEGNAPLESQLTVYVSVKP